MKTSEFSTVLENDFGYQILYVKNIEETQAQPLEEVKSKIEELQENPFAGKCLEKELSGYLSIQAKRFRIIYKIRNNDQSVEIHHVGHRKDIYELFRGAIAK